MLKWIKRVLAPPVFEGDEEKTRVAWLLNIILLTLFVRAVVIRIITASEPFRLTSFAPFVLLLLVLIFVMRRGSVWLASVITVCGFWLSLTVAAVQTGGIHSFTFRNYILPVLVAGLLLGRAASIATAAVSVLAGLAMWLAEINGLIAAPTEFIQAPDILITHAISLLIAGVLVTLATSSIQQALEHARQELAERKHAEEHLRESTEQLRTLMNSLRSVREEEGVRIAREIHDELGAALTSTRWDLEGMEKTVSDLNEDLQPELRVRIGKMFSSIDAAIDTVRRISSQLRPSVLDHLGLAAAVEWQTEQFQTRTGITCRCSCSIDNLVLEGEQSTAVFRIFQEALTNVLRHAHATEIDVSLEEGAEDELILRVRDNGKGIREEEKTNWSSLGLLGIRERARLIGGTIDITGIPGKGTTVSLRVPHLSGVNAREAV